MSHGSPWLIETDDSVRKPEHSTLAISFERDGIRTAWVRESDELTTCNGRQT
jgi:hypothetical protein